MENKDIILHLAQDSDDFVNNKATIRLSYETSDGECSNIFSVVKRIDSSALDNIAEMETIIESMKIDLLILSTKNALTIKPGRPRDQKK